MGRMRVAVAVAVLVATAAAAVPAQDTAPSRRAFTVTAREGRFEPNRLDVSKNDLVTITLQSGDGAYSFAIDAYRLMKRVGAGDAVTFSFRADQAGRFVFYCSLSTDERCRGMRGTLTVTDR
jgi:heme/copper-type cytochrome/quinol oxidase subunit 2